MRDAIQMAAETAELMAATVRDAQVAADRFARDLERLVTLLEHLAEIIRDAAL